MNIKVWKLWLFTSICFLLVAIINLISKKYLLGSIYILLVVICVYLTVSHYKEDKNPRKNKIPDAELKSMDIELKNLIAKGKEYEAIRKCREVTGLSLKESKEYVDSMSKESLN